MKYQYGYLGAEKAIGENDTLWEAVMYVERLGKATNPEEIEFTNYMYIVVSYNDDDVYVPLLIYNFIDDYWEGER